MDKGKGNDKLEGIEQLARKLADAVPDSVKQMGSGVQQTFESILQSSFHSMNLVTREQFDTQTKVLARTRQKLEALEKRVAELEAELNRPPRQ